MVRYCTSGLLYFTSQWRVKCSPQVQCLTILHSSHAMINLLLIINNTAKGRLGRGPAGWAMAYPTSRLRENYRSFVTAHAHSLNMNH